MTQNIHGISRRHFLAGIAASGMLVGGASGTRAQGDQAPRKGGRLRVGLSAGSAKDSLDAKGALTEADIARQNNLYDTLLYFNSDYQIEPGLAETVEADDTVVETDGVRLVVDAMSLKTGRRLTGWIIDQS